MSDPDHPPLVHFCYALLLLPSPSRQAINLLFDGTTSLTLDNYGRFKSKDISTVFLQLNCASPLHAQQRCGIYYMARNSKEILLLSQTGYVQHGI